MNSNGSGNSISNANNNNNVINGGACGNYSRCVSLVDAQELTR